MKYLIKYRYLFIGFLGLSLLLTACKTVPQASVPEAPLPLSYRGADQGNAKRTDTTKNIADIPWQDFFQDTTLKGLIRSGLDYNYDLLRAIKRIDIAEVQLKQARLLNLPSVGLTVSGQYNRPSENGLNGQNIQSVTGSKHFEDYTAALDLSWEADIWGKIRQQKQVVLEQYLQTKEARHAVQTKLIADIARGYYNLLVLDQQLQIATSSLILADSTLALTQLLKTAGKVNELSVQQTAAQRHTVALLIPSLQDNITEQENALKLLTGQLPGRVERDITLGELKAPTGFATGLPAELIGHRPDVRSAELDLKISISKIGIAKANMYPSLRITASGGVEALKASKWFNLPGSLFGLAAGSVLQPIFEKGALKRDYKVAELQKEDAVLGFRQKVLGAVTEVSDALTHFSKLKESAVIANNQVETLNQAIDNASLLYKSGLANYLEVISAQNNALQAKLNLAFIHGQELSSTVDIYRSLGGGWR